MNKTAFETFDESATFAKQMAQSEKFSSVSIVRNKNEFIVKCTPISNRMVAGVTESQLVPININPLTEYKPQTKGTPGVGPRGLKPGESMQAIRRSNLLRDYLNAPSGDIMDLGKRMPGSYGAGKKK